MTVFTEPNIQRILTAELQPWDVLAGARTTFYIASEFLTTDSGDTPASQIYTGSLLGDVHFRREMFSGANIGGRTTPDRGQLVVANTLEPQAAASRYDAWLDPAKYTWQAAPCKIYIHDKALGFATRTKVFDGVVEQPGYDENTISFPLRNKLRLLDKLIQANRYDDSYGDDLEDKPKPVALGWMYNVTAILQENRIYQVHDGEIESVTAVRDKGSPLTLDTAIGTSGDVANRAALVSASPASGKYATCLAEGLIKVGLEPDGDLTVDGKGSTLGGTWSALPGDIYEWIVEVKLAAGLVDADAVTEMNATGYEVAFHTGLNEYNTLDLLDDVLGGCWIWYGADRAGDFDGGVFALPGTATLAIGENESDRDRISVEAIGQVAWKVTLKYRHNQTVQQGGSLATGIGEENIRLYGQEWQTVTVDDSSVKTAWPEAVELTFTSRIYDSVDALAEANKLLTFWKSPRRRIRAQTSLKPLAVDINDVIELTHSRFNLSAGVDFRVVVFDEYYLAARTEVALVA